MLCKLSVFNVLYFLSSHTALISHRAHGAYIYCAASQSPKVSHLLCEYTEIFGEICKNAAARCLVYNASAHYIFRAERAYFYIRGSARSGRERTFFSRGTFFSHF